jgi:vacuolar-type H+-ATPase catalytic subunit A/Vma1
MSSEREPAQVIQFQRKEASALNLWEQYVTRRHRKQHERIKAERARQKALAGQDVEEAVRNVAQGSAGAQQGMYGAGT